MGCCGEKRKAWLEESRHSAIVDTSENDPAGLEVDKPDRIFEYTGSHAISINGAVSGTTYFFRFPGDKIAVNHLDAFALMAEPDLKLSS